ncbi:VWA domain-containing protein [Streptomyces sp. JCM 18897]
MPAPTASTSVVTVKTGGDRNGDTSVAPLAGVRLGLYEAEDGGTPAFTCVSDADGDCSFVVTGTAAGGANEGRQFWVRQVAAPDGWFVNDTFRTGGTVTTPYRFQTPRLAAATTYSSTATGPGGFMVGSGGSNRTASTGTWQSSRVNPALPERCGLRVALIMDLSGSMSGSVPALKTAADTFVDALQGTPSSMARFTFSSYSPATRGGANAPGLVSVSTLADAAAFKRTYASWTNATAEGSTNWDRALYEPASATSQYDVAVVITDGMPTNYSIPGGPSGGASGSVTRFRELESGIASANALKNEGTRVLAVGVGEGTSGNAALNLASISGTEKYDGDNIATADYFQEADFAGAGAALRRLALAPCTPAVSVVKQIEAEDGTRTNAPAGWTFDAATQTPGVTVTSPRTTTGDGTGAVSFPLVYDGAETATLSVAERQQPGYQVVQQGGRNAVCTDRITERPVEVTDDPGGGPGFSVDVGVLASVTCSVVNKAPPELVPASLTVAKQWSVTTDGAPQVYPEGEQPRELRADLTLGDPTGNGSSPWEWGTVRDGYAAGEQVGVSEAPRFAAGVDCDLTGVDFDGTELDPAAPSTTVTLAAGANRHQVTNHVTCRTKLTLAKRVLGGEADPDDWTLRATGADGSLPGPVGTGVSAGTTGVPVTSEARYQLAESLTGTDPSLLNYRQVDNRTDYQSNPLSTGSMNCIAYDRDGTELLGWNDGINGGVNVPLGTHVTCTATNETVPLTLVKEVEGGTAVPEDWRITATPIDPDPVGVPAQTVTGAPGPAGAVITVRPGQAYRITEDGGPGGYELTSSTCRTDDGATGPRDLVLTVNSGQRGTCTLVNTAVPPSPATLTLVKEVDNRYGGTARPTDWTLHADGTGQSLEGVTGSPEVTGVQVDSGRYVLAERGPDGYDASGWSCGAEGEEPAPVADSAVDIAPGQDVTCTITNTHRKPGPKPTPDPSPGPHPPGPLPDTGLAGAWLGAGALLLVAAGAWLVFRVRRSARG